MSRDLCLKYWQHELFASRFGLFSPFLTLATIFLITIFMGITLLFFENLGLCSPFKEGFICECGKRATPDSLISKNLCTALICPPIPLFLRQLFEPRDLFGDRSTCEKIDFHLLPFSPGLSFSAFFMLTVSREVEMVKFNSEVFSSGDQSFRAATTYFQERVKKANLTINIYEGANHMFW